jgi:hypothetical protein
MPVSRVTVAPYSVRQTCFSSCHTDRAFAIREYRKAEGAQLLALLAGVRLSESTFRRRARAAGRLTITYFESHAPPFRLAQTAPPR